MTDLNQSVIKLHDIARIVEQTMGVGKLSIDIRKCADRLSAVINLDEPQPDLAKGDQ